MRYRRLVGKRLLEALLVLIAAVSCGPAPSYTSSHGAEYWFDGAAWPPAQIEAQEAGFEDSVVSSGLYTREQVERALSTSRVQVYPDKFRCSSSPTTWCAGDEDYEQLSVESDGCPGKSALTHEVAHWLEFQAKGITDYTHTVELELWKAADAEQPGSCKD